MQRPGPDAEPADWDVYADDLEQRGDPAAELIRLTLAGASIERRAACAIRTVAPEAAAWEPRCLLDWRYLSPGIVVLAGPNWREATATLELVLASPLGRTIDRVQVVAEPVHQIVHFGPIMDRLGEAAARGQRFTELALVDLRALADGNIELAERPAIIHCNPIHTLPLAHVERLDIAMTRASDIDWRNLVAPSLRAFSLQTRRYATPAESPSAALALAHWPALEDLSLSLSEPPPDPRQRDEIVDWQADLRMLFASLAASALTALRLTDFRSTASLYRALTNARWPVGLRRLALSDPWLVGAVRGLGRPGAVAETERRAPRSYTIR